MAKVLENPNGRRIIKLSIDDVFMIISQYQQICNFKTLDSAEARDILSDNCFYLPEDV